MAPCSALAWVRVSAPVPQHPTAATPGHPDGSARAVRLPMPLLPQGLPCLHRGTREDSPAPAWKLPLPTWRPLCQPGDPSVPAWGPPLCQPCLRLRFRGNLVVNHSKVINEAMEHDPSQEVPGCPAAATPLWWGLLPGHPLPTGPTAVTLLICSGQAAPGHSGEGWHDDGTTPGTATVTVQPSQGCLLGRG